MKKLILFLVLLCHYTYAQNTSGTTPDVTASGYTSKPIKIGDVLPVQLASAHPYNITGEERIAFEQEFYNKNSYYIKLYFENFELAPGDYVEIKGLNSGETVIYSERGKIINQNGQMLSNFWSQVVFDERVRVRLYTYQSSTAYGFDLTKVAYGYSEARINALFTGKSICGADDKEPIECYNGTTMYNKGRAVCRLIINGSGSCTGWLLGCDGHVMTNNHCIETASDASNTDFVFNFQTTSCSSTTGAPSDVVATSSRFIKTNTGLDYTLVKLIPSGTRTLPNILSTYGFLSLSSVAPVLNDRIYIVGHPGGRRKEITVKTDQGGTAQGFAKINRVTTNGVRYYADTEGGSSGSPVLSFNSNLVVAIHNTGGCTNGSSGRSDRLIADIGTDMPNCGINNSGGSGGGVPTCNTTIASYPYNESFENNNIGNFTQGTNDDINWTVLTGATSSTGTGPSNASNGRYYAYIEASNPNNPNKKANLSLPCLNLNNIPSPKLTFSYHMYGSNMGTLKVEASTNGTSWTTLWTRSGNKGNNWINDTISLNAYTTETALRVRFSGVTGSGFASDMAIDDISISAGRVSCSSINNFPYTEGFETGLGAWTQATNDDFDWTRNNGSTGSTGTGPSAASVGNFYVYTEASNPNNPYKTAYLVSPCFNLTNLSLPQLTFDYHMLGATMGTLSVEVSVGGGAWTSIWTRTGNNGTAWTDASINLNPYTNATDLRIRFKGKTNNGFESDMAIDDISIRTSRVNCSSINSFPYTEGFETGLGAWTQATNDDFDWTRNNGSTGSTGTGPNAASVGNFYVYTEASNPNNPYKTAYLVSPCFNLTNLSLPQLTFDYHMLGATMGTLSVEVSVGGGAWTSVWTRTGNNGTAWTDASINLNPYTNATDLRIRFKGKTNNGFESDMAIDDISIASATFSCSSNITTYPYNEGFESGLGRWTQTTGDDFDWTRKNGATGSTGTGPNAAHQGSFYVYMEASSPNNPAKTAILNSPCFNLTAVTDPKLTFNYHMFGNTMGSLILEIRTSTNNWTPLWSRSGDKGNQWHSANISLQNYTNLNNVIFRFRGTTGSGFSSDIAIDAIKVTSATGINITTVADETTILEVGPNPFNNYLEIHTNIKNTLPYQITNIQGQVVKMGELKGSTSLEVSNLSTGVYFIRFKNDQQDVIKKLIKY